MNPEVPISPPLIRCPDCSAPVLPGEACMACFFKEALAVPTVSENTETAPENRFFATLGRFLLPFDFAGHRVVREIARGGMGTVYEAEQVALKRTVALKLVRSPAFARTEEVTRFRAEAEAVARLDHPHIVPVFEVGEWEGQPYFTMKLLPGGTLAERLKAGPMPPEEAARMMAKLARAVHHAHQRGVLHRDLKPGNVLLDAAGEPCLTDFGLAKLSDADSGLTLTSAHLGTPQYMSPEQAEGRARDLTAASDVWSLGAMFYQMLAGVVPFAGATHGEIFRRITEEEPASLGKGPQTLHAPRGQEASGSSETGAASVPADLATLAHRCLHKDPARRLPTALHLAEELERWLAGEPILSRPISRRERSLRWMRKHPLRVALLGGLAFSVAAGSLSSLVLWRRAESNAAEARTARDAAAEDAYYATVANALHDRSRFDFASARQLLASLPPERRGFEWRLVHGLCRGDDLWSVSPALAGPRLLATDPSTGKVWLLTADRKLSEVDLATGRLTVSGAVPAAAHLKPGLRFAGFESFAFAPDGAHYFVVENQALLVVERASGKLVFQGDQATSAEAAWLDASRIIFGGSSFYRIAEGEPTAWVLEVRTKQVMPLPAASIAGPFAVSPDGARLAWVRGMPGGGHQIVVGRTAELGTAMPEVMFPDTRGPGVASLSFSETGASLAVLSDDTKQASVCLYEIPGGQLLRKYPVSSQSRLATGGGPPLLGVWGQEPWLTVINPTRAMPPLAVYDDANQGPGDFLDKERPIRPPLRLLTRSAASQNVGMLFGHEAPPRSLVYLPGQKAWLSAGLDGTVRRWPLEAAVSQTHRLNNIDTFHNWFHPIASPDGGRVLCLSMNGQSFLHRFGDWDRHTFPAGSTGVACFDDGRVLVREAEACVISCWRAGEQTATKLWETSCQPAVQGFPQIIHSATSADGKRVAVLMPGKFFVVEMDARTVRETDDQVMDYGFTPGQTVDLSPDGQIVAVTGFKGFRARLYRADDPAAGHEKLNPLLPVETHDTACVFSRDGKRLHVGNEDGWVRVFEVATRRELPAEAWQAHNTAITALAVSRSGDIVATAAEGGIVLWSASLTPGQPRRERLHLPQDRARNWMHFATGDTALLHSAPERPVEVWDAPAE